MTKLFYNIKNLTNWLIMNIDSVFLLFVFYTSLMSLFTGYIDPNIYLGLGFIFTFFSILLVNLITPEGQRVSPLFALLTFLIIIIGIIGFFYNHFTPMQNPPSFFELFTITHQGAIIGFIVGFFVWHNVTSIKK